ncbi:MAG: alkaline phosphatase family protein [Gemmatimonadota bacterium]
MHIPLRAVGLFFGPLALAAALLPASVRAQTEGPPTLVVMIVVDQLGGDLIDRFEPALEGGFRRFMDEGRRYTRASHAHAMTETAPGHATLATGVVPSRHGIVGNAWRQRAGFDWQTTYAVGDPEHPILGYEREEALEGRSPVNLLRSGLADWVKAQNPQARTVSISKKDRSAVVMAGQTRENAWWMIDQLGIFGTSTFYAQRYPGWLTRFNAQVMTGIRQPTEWRSEVPSVARVLARADHAEYEGDGEHTTFPHLAHDEVPPDNAQAFNLWAFDQPRADDAVLALARVAIAEFELGQREGRVDFLALSFSALDRVGHAYGPRSQEALSTLVHLDVVLSELMRFLDQEVGPGRWVAGLAGDHGSPESPEAEREAGFEGAERIDEGERFGALGDALRDAANGGGSPDAIAARVAEIVEERGLADAAYTHQELVLGGGGEPADSFAVLYRNSHYPGRAWGALSRFGVELRFGERDLVTSYPTGTTHGSPYWYDRHVEMMWIGPGVPQGETDEPVYTVDFAPTLAGLARVRTPEDLDGRRLF